MATNYNFSIVRNGLVMYLDAANSKSYPGSGTIITDLSRNGNNGTLTNGPTFSNTNGGTISFDGANDYILMADNSIFDFGTGDFALEIWIYLNTLGVDPTLFILKSYNVANGGIGFWISNGTLTIYTTAQIAEPSPSVGINRWHHIVFTRISGTSYLYNNTILRDSRAFTPSISVSDSVAIGFDTQFNNGPLNGRVGSARIYSGKGLTASQVLQNYNATKKRFGL